MRDPENECILLGVVEPNEKTPSAMNADAVKVVLKAVEEAIAKVGEGNPYEGGVYLKVQMQYLDEGKQIFEKIKVGEVKKTTLQKVTVYGVKAKALKATDHASYQSLVKAIESDTDETRLVVVGKAVEFKDVTVKYGNEEKDIPVLKQLLDKYKGGMYYYQDIEGKEKVYYQQMVKK